MNRFWRVFLFPSKYIIFMIPLTILLAFVAGLYIDTSALKAYTLYVSMIFIVYPMMIGIKLEEVIRIKHKKLILVSLGLNFGFLPLLAYLLGITFFADNPQLFAGLAMLSLLPTGTMTVGFTMLAKGNVPVAVQLSIFSLLFGAIVAPWYLLAMVGQYIPIDLWMITKTILMLIFIPLIIGVITYTILLRFMSDKDFFGKVKPKINGVAVYGMLYVIFTSISINSHKIIAEPTMLFKSILVLFIFYVTIYVVHYFIGRRLFATADIVPLVYAAGLRNISIALSLSITSLGPDAAFIVALCFLFQQQFAILFSKILYR